MRRARPVNPIIVGMAVTPPTLEHLLATLCHHLPDWRTRYAVSRLGVFGSYVRQEHHAQSDIDVLVEFADAPTLLEFVRLERELSDRLGVKVDLVMKNALKPTIGALILREVVYCDSP